MGAAPIDITTVRVRYMRYANDCSTWGLVGDLDGTGYAGANFQEVTYFINVDRQAHPIVIPALAARAFVLHPVHLAAGATDAQATYDSTTGTFTIPHGRGVRRAAVIP